MKFDDLDKRMRVYETGHDFCVLPNTYMVARIDVRGFTKLTKEKHDFQRPFDETFRDYMIETVKHLMSCGFNVIYGFTESDEISLLFDINEDTFSRKIRKYNSILAGEASAKFSLMLGDLATFDCRISQLPREQDVTDYFRWRNEDAHRNALNAHCYWILREQQGKTAKAANNKLEGKSVAYKNELLFQHGINFNDLPSWQKRGIGVYWEGYQKLGWNPIKEKEESTLRRRLTINLDIPKGNSYDEFVSKIIRISENP